MRNNIKKNIQQSVSKKTMAKIAHAIRKALNENFDFDDFDDVEYAEKVDGNPDLMLGHLLKKQSTDDYSYIDEIAKQLVGKTLSIKAFDKFAKEWFTDTFKIQGFERLDWSDDVHFYDDYGDEIVIRCIGQKNNTQLHHLLNGEKIFCLHDDFTCKVQLEE